MDMASGGSSGPEDTVSRTAFTVHRQVDQSLALVAEAHRSIDVHVRQGKSFAVE